MFEALDSILGPPRPSPYGAVGCMGARLLLLAVAAAAALAALDAYASPTPGAGLLHPVAAVAVNETLPLWEAQAPLQPLTSVSCGNAVAVVYGPEARKPLLVVVYSTGPGGARDAAACPGRLAPCLTAAGHPEAVEELRETLQRLAVTRTKTITIAATAPARAPIQPTVPGRPVIPAPAAAASGGGAADWPQRAAAVLATAAAAAGVTLLWAKRSRGIPWRS